MRIDLFLIFLLVLPSVTAQQVGLGGAVKSSPVLVDLDMNSSNGLEIVVGSDGGYMHALYSNGTILNKWNIQSGYTYFINGPSSPSVGDIGNDGDTKIIIGGQEARTMGAPGPGYMWTYSSTLPNSEVWRYSTLNPSVSSSPLMVDLDGDGDLEMLIGTSKSGVSNYLYALYPNGALYWSKIFSADKISTPVVGDLDGDGQSEVAVAVSDGKVYILNRNNGGEIRTLQTGGLGGSSPALADLDNDGDLEILITSTDGKVYAWHGNGSRLAGWPVQANTFSDSSPAVADLDGDGDLEVVVTTLVNDIYAYQKDGTLMSGFPMSHAESGSGSSPGLVDLDGDGILEIIVGTSLHIFNESTIPVTDIKSGKIYAWHLNGSYVSGFPQATGNYIKSSPAAADIDNDGLVEVVIGSDDGNLYIFEAGASSWNSGWPMFNYDARNTRRYSAPTVQISAPANATMYRQGQAISFNAAANDVDGSIVSYNWSSDVDGFLGNTSSFSKSLSLGNHSISLLVTDNDGKIAKTANDVSIVVNVPPNATITSPADGVSYKTGASISFSGSGNDSDGTVASYYWSADGIFLSNSTSFSTSFSNTGTRTITFVVTDSEGLNGSTSVDITITERSGGSSGGSVPVVVPTPAPVATSTVFQNRGVVTVKELAEIVESLGQGSKAKYVLDSHASPLASLYASRGEVVFSSKDEASLSGSIDDFYSGVQRKEKVDLYKEAVDYTLEHKPGFLDIIVVRGDMPFDSLVAAPLANLLNAPIIYVKPNEIPSVDYAVLEKMQGKGRIYIIGGPEAVSTEVELNLRGFAGAISRLDGETRYETSVEVARQIMLLSESTMAISTSGKDPMIYAATLGVKYGSPIVYIDTPQVNSETPSGELGAHQSVVRDYLFDNFDTRGFMYYE